MIKVIYNKTCGRCVQSEPLTSGMVGQPIELEYSSDFDGLTLTAVFTNGKTTVDVLNPGNQCMIPHEVLDTVGTLVKVGIYAVRGNELVIPTVYANIGVVQKGADPSGDVSADPTLPVWAQIQGIIGNLNDLTTEAKNNLVAAINEAAQSGGGGGSSIELDTTLSAAGKAADAKAVGDALAGKQDTINDLETIRSGAAKGATALQTVPSTYRTALAQDVIDSDLGDRIEVIEGKEAGWDSKYVKPTNGIPKTDLANAVQASLGKADTALQSVPSTYRTAAAQDAIDSGKVDKVTGKGLSTNDYTNAAKAKVDALASVATSGNYNDLSNKPTIPAPITEQTVSGWGFTKNTGTYSKPTGGIPKTDLASTVQTSLDKADTALQTHQSLADYRTALAQDIIDSDLSDRIEVIEGKEAGWNGKQDKLIAGENITIAADGKTISAADYTLTEADKAEIADMVNGATIVQAPKYVNSTTEMTDVNRPYVLISTGHIWANANVEIETTLTDTITATNDNPYHDGYRLGSDATSDSMTHDAKGYFLTPLIDLTKAPYQGKTIQLHLEGAHFASDTAFETWIQARVYGVDKSVLVNRYFVFADMTNDNNIAHHCNGTMSIAYNSETSATVTLSVPPTYGPSATPIGYIRFCAKGAVANSNITITYTSISTGVQWYDTGTTYGGGQDAQLAAKVAALNNEGSAPAAYNLLTPAVIAYYNKAAYPDGDYSATNFVRATLPYRADIPQPVTLKWQHNEDAVQTTISVNTSATVLSSGVKQYDATGYDNYPIYNLLPNKTYYYTVTHLLADGSLVTAKTGSFTTSNVPWRLLKVDGIQNVRDLGGWTGLNGKKVKYGKLFRGSALDDSEFPYLLLSGHGRTEMVSDIGIRADLDLRYNYTESAISKDMAFLCKGYGSYAQAITTPDYRSAFKTILEWIVARLSESHPKPVYFHCQGGCDRTGTLSFLLLGLLGVSESDLAREYELSSFSAIGAGRVRNSTVYGYSEMVAALKTYAGSTLTEKFADFAETGCGVSADTISSFRGLMLE